MYILPWPQLIEYGFLIIVWTLYGAVWVGSIMCSRYDQNLNIYVYRGKKRLSSVGLIRDGSILRIFSDRNPSFLLLLKGIFPNWIMCKQIV